MQQLPAIPRANLQQPSHSLRFRICNLLQGISITELCRVCLLSICTTVPQAWQRLRLFGQDGTSLAHLLLPGRYVEKVAAKACPLVPNN